VRFLRVYPNKEMRETKGYNVIKIISVNFRIVGLLYGMLGTT